MKRFLKDMAERAIKTVAQTAIATIGTTTAFGAVDWKLVASTAVLAGIVSVLTSVASRPIGSPNTASILREDDR